jgi:hypothetical protein
VRKQRSERRGNCGKNARIRRKVAASFGRGFPMVVEKSQRPVSSVLIASLDYLLDQNMLHECGEVVMM